MLKEIFKKWCQALRLKHRELIREKHELLYVFWECTMNCNFLCKHCWSNAWEKYIEETLTTDQIKSAFLDIANNHNAKKITIAVTWWEPLLRKDLFEVMEYATSLWFNWGMVTNGFLINKTVIEKMRKSNMRTIDISIDWLWWVHDVFRNKKWSFQKNLENIETLLKENFLNPFRITTTVHKNNIDDLEKMYELFSWMWLKDWRLLTMDPIWRWEFLNKDLLLSNEEKDKVYSFILEKNKKWKIKLVSSCSHFLWDKYEDKVRPSFFFCNTWINIASILHNGDIFVCTNVPKEKKLIQWNVKKDSFSKIWNERFEFFRNKYRIEDEKCRECEYWEECLWWAVHTYDIQSKQQKVCFMKK